MSATGPLLARASSPPAGRAALGGGNEIHMIPVRGKFLSQSPTDPSYGRGHDPVNR